MTKEQAVDLHEHDACGTGYVIVPADKDATGRTALDYAIDLLIKNDHRIGRTPGTVVDEVMAENLQGVKKLVREKIDIGDGSGIVTEIPFDLIERDIAALRREGVSRGDYGVARIYLPADAQQRAQAKSIVWETLKEFGFDALGERAVAGNLKILSSKIRDDHAHITDIVVKRPDAVKGDDKAFRVKMYDCQMEIERKLQEHALSKACHVGAISDRVTVYKGVFSAQQVGAFFDDFRDKGFKTRFAFYHGRYATNAGTRVPNVHPFIKGSTVLAHNGEIVTIKGNTARLERAMKAVTGKDFTIPSGITDSHTLAYALGFLCHTQQIDAPEAMKRLVSAGWQADERLDEATKGMMEMFSLGTAPYAGPAYLGYIDALSDGITLNSIMDFGGLRPCTIMTLADGTIISGSENALPDSVLQQNNNADTAGDSPTRIVAMRSLKPLEQVQFNVDTGEIKDNDALLSEMIARNEGTIGALKERLHDYKVDTKSYEQFDGHVTARGGFDGIQRRFALGHDKQTSNFFSIHMALTGKQSVGAMGGVTPAWYLTNIPTPLFRAAKSAFSIVTAPPHDAKREGYLMDMSTVIGNVSNPASQLIKLPSAVMEPGGRDKLKRELDEYKVPHHTLDCTFKVRDNDKDGFAAFKTRLKEICQEAEAQARSGVEVLILSDYKVGSERQAVDGMLISALVHKHLDEKGLRDKVSLVFDARCVRNEHDAFMLLTNGIDAVYPAMHYANVTEAHAAGDIKVTGDARRQGDARGQAISKEQALKNAHMAMHDGVVNAMSRCGIPSISAVRDAQMFTFEGVNIEKEKEPELWKAFGGHNAVYSPLGIFGLEKIYSNSVALHRFTAKHVTGTELPDIHEYLRQKSQRVTLGAMGSKLFAEPVGPKRFNELMQNFRTSFTAKSRMPEESVKAIVTLGGGIDPKLTLGELVHTLGGETERGEEAFTVIRTARDALVNEFGERAADPYVKALNALTLGEVASYHEWKKAHENGVIKIVLPGDLLKENAKDAESPDVARAHRSRLRREGEKDADKVQKLLLKRANHADNYTVLPKLTPDDIDRYPVDEADKLAFGTMEDYERTDPRGVMDMLFLKKDALTDSPHEGPAASDVARRLYIASMSVGALTPLANRFLSNVANSLGIAKETGEGGMPPADQNLGVRSNDDAQDTIVQIGSGRFGVDIDFVISPDRWVDGTFKPGCVTIKMAQGAKPGEGGQLPGAKVTELIASLRHAFPGVDLPSPAPHHDMYSIEDLYQMVRDCKRTAIKGVEREVGVKIASSGPDVFAVGLGIAKMGVDSITFAGGDGGTGAGPLTSIQHTGRSMEDAIVLARKLDEAGFVSVPKRRYEGGIKTPLDFIRAVCAGYDEVGFGTAAAIAQGCKWLQMCNVSGACTPGVANNEIAFDGDAKATQKYFLGFMHGVSDMLKRMEVDGKPVTSIDQIRGRTDLLEVLESEKKVIEAQGGDLSDLEKLISVEGKKPSQPDAKFRREPDPKEQLNYQLEDWMVDAVIDKIMHGDDARTHTEGNTTHVFLDSPVESTQFIGPRLAAFVAAVNGYLKTNPQCTLKEIVTRVSGRCGDSALNAWKTPATEKIRSVAHAPKLEIHLKADGHGAQSFGAFACDGTHYDVTGALQYGAFKLTSGGEHVVRNPLGAEGMAAGNSFGYGARGGFFAIEGNLGPRAGVRNAGASYVIDGDVGDNAFTFMSRGSVVLLGDAGYNFGAGSSAGIMAVYDKDGKAHLQKRCHSASVTVSEADTEYQAKIREMLQKHVKLISNSKDGKIQTPSRAQQILDHWDEEKKHFYTVTPLYLDQALTRLSEKMKYEDAQAMRQEIRQVYTRQDGVSTAPLFSPLEQVWARRHRIDDALSLSAA